MDVRDETSVEWGGGSFRLIECYVALRGSLAASCLVKDPEVAEKKEHSSRVVSDRPMKNMVGFLVSTVPRCPGKGLTRGQRHAFTRYRQSLIMVYLIAPAGGDPGIFANLGLTYDFFQPSG